MGLHCLPYLLHYLTTSLLETSCKLPDSKICRPALCCSQCKHSAGQVLSTHIIKSYCGIRPGLAFLPCCVVQLVDAKLAPFDANSPIQRYVSWPCSDSVQTVNTLCKPTNIYSMGEKANESHTRIALIRLTNLFFRRATISCIWSVAGSFKPAKQTQKFE